MDQKEKTKALLKLTDRELVDRILSYPERTKLNRDEGGNRRRYPSAEMAVRAKRQMAKDPDYKISDKMRFCMADSFSRYSRDQVKVAGITFAKADPDTLKKIVEKEEGVKTVYEMSFALRPEPENPYDKNAVAVYAENMDGEEVKIGYVPAAYVATRPITEPLAVKGTLTDHSNGHFKTISYSLDMDTEELERSRSSSWDKGVYTYRMPFLLNGPVKEGAGEYLTSCYGKGGWAARINDELEYWGVDGQVKDVSFQFPSSRSGEILVKTEAPLSGEAAATCGSFFRYSLEAGIGSDLRRDGYVLPPAGMPVVNTREKTYFSLMAEPVEEEDRAFAESLEELSPEGLSL